MLSSILGGVNSVQQRLRHSQSHKPEQADLLSILRPLTDKNLTKIQENLVSDPADSAAETFQEVLVLPDEVAAEATQETAEDALAIALESLRDYNLLALELHNPVKDFYDPSRESLVDALIEDYLVMRQVHGGESNSHYPSLQDCPVRAHETHGEGSGANFLSTLAERLLPPQWLNDFWKPEGGRRRLRVKYDSDLVPGDLVKTAAVAFGSVSSCNFIEKSFGSKWQRIIDEYVCLNDIASEFTGSIGADDLFIDTWASLAQDEAFEHEFGISLSKESEMRGTDLDAAFSSKLKLYSNEMSREIGDSRDFMSSNDLFAVIMFDELLRTGDRLGMAEKSAGNRITTSMESSYQDVIYDKGGHDLNTLSCKAKKFEFVIKTVLKEMMFQNDIVLKLPHK